ncbi:hypothetical protein [Nocardia sp. NPDC004722]
MFRDLFTVLDAFELGKADVLAFYFGGLLVQFLAVAVPERIGKPIIASSNVRPRGCIRWFAGSGSGRRTYCVGG